jgi:hypothetical protein
MGVFFGIEGVSGKISGWCFEVGGSASPETFRCRWWLVAKTLGSRALSANDEESTA